MRTSILALPVLLGALVAVSASAESEAVIGRQSVILHDDGTWTLKKDVRAMAERGKKTVILHPDGTWEPAAARKAKGAVTNLSLGKPARQNGTYGNAWYREAGMAVDGNIDDGAHYSFTSGNAPHWWEVDLGKEYKLDHVVIYNRPDDVPQLQDFRILISKQPFADGPVPEEVGSKIKEWRVKEQKKEFNIGLKGKTGRYVRIQRRSKEALCLEEVEVMGR